MRNVPIDLSLSARRAWIEIPIVPAELTTLVNVALRKESVDRNETQKPKPTRQNQVALRKESVDRNTSLSPANLCDLPSLSARRAWIEISWARIQYCSQPVALRKESVDRNRLYASSGFDFAEGRSPQGERG